MSDLTALERGALRAALLKLTKDSSYFDITTFDQMCKVYGALPDRRAYNALRLLHCVSWRDMDADTRREAMRAIAQTFTSDAVLIDMMAEVFSEPTKTAEEKPSLLRRLTGGVL